MCLSCGLELRALVLGEGGDGLGPDPTPGGSFGPRL